MRYKKNHSIIFYGLLVHWYLSCAERERYCRHYVFVIMQIDPHLVGSMININLSKIFFKMKLPIKCLQNRGGSRISEKGVHMHKGVGVSFC